jgi:hypothetical protein
VGDYFPGGTGQRWMKTGHWRPEARRSAPDRNPSPPHLWQFLNRLLKGLLAAQRRRDTVFAEFIFGELGYY